MTRLYDNYVELRTKAGFTATQAADQLKISPNTMAKYEKELRLPRGSPVLGSSEAPPSILDDFPKFRERYFHRVSTPWQADAAKRLLALTQTPEKSYVVINVAPGSGKSTLFTHDIPAWL